MLQVVHIMLNLKTVKTLMRLLEKAKTRPYLALVEYKNTPGDDTASPVQLSMRRRLRSE